MNVRKSPSKKRSTNAIPPGIPLDSSLTSIEWLPNMQIGEGSTTTSIPPPTTTNLNSNSNKSSLPVISNTPHKLEAVDVEINPTQNHDETATKPPFSYVTLIRQAILNNPAQRMTLNEIYQWIIENYPYFRTAPPKWKNSIRHNLSLNKCFKKLQRNTNDPGKGSYWAVDESFDNGNNLTSRKRKFEEIQSSIPIMPSSPSSNLMQQNTVFYTNNNPMICGEIGSVGGQSSSTDESDSTTSFAANQNFLQTDDLNFELTASFRRFCEQVLDPTTNPTTHVPTNNLNSWPTELFPNGDNSSFIQSVKLASSGEINFNEVDVKPYCEFLEGFRSTSTFQQDPDNLFSLTSSLSSFFDHTGITNLAQSRFSNEHYSSNQTTISSNLLSSDPMNNCSAIPAIIDEAPTFDYTTII